MDGSRRRTRPRRGSATPIDRLSQRRSAEVLEIGDKIDILTEGKKLGERIDVTIPRVEDQAPGVFMVIVAVHAANIINKTNG